MVVVVVVVVAPIRLCKSSIIRGGGVFHDRKGSFRGRIVVVVDVVVVDVVVVDAPIRLCKSLMKRRRFHDQGPHCCCCCCFCCCC